MQRRLVGIYGDLIRIYCEWMIRMKSNVAVMKPLMDEKCRAVVKELRVSLSKRLPAQPAAIAALSQLDIALDEAMITVAEAAVVAASDSSFAAKGGQSAEADAGHPLFQHVPARADHGGDP